jgi:hypothetical protein
VREKQEELLAKFDKGVAERNEEACSFTRNEKDFKDYITQMNKNLQTYHPSIAALQKSRSSFGSPFDDSDEPSETSDEHERSQARELLLSHISSTQNVKTQNDNIYESDSTNVAGSSS